MFRHFEKGRTLVHNVELASLLSTIAGMVNIVGVLAFHTLTTNVTAHFTFITHELFLEHYKLVLVSLAFVFSFFLGAFLANTSMELTLKKMTNSPYVFPISLEILFLLLVALADFKSSDMPIWLSCILLLAMGVQNAMVTKISGSVVRTTHLTGLFTDLGIELSQMIFYKKNKDRKRLKRGIILKMIIIAGFFLGGIIGAFLYGWFERKALLVPVVILLFALYYDRFLLRYYRSKPKNIVIEGIELND